MKYRPLNITLLCAVYPLALLTFTLFATGHARAQTCSAAPSGLVSWWPLDETTGTEAADIIDGNPGTHIDGPTPTAGIVSGGLSFDRVDDYVRIPDAANLNPGTSNFSVDFWMKTSASNSRENILSKRPVCNSTSGRDIRLRATGHIRAELLGSGTNLQNPSTIPVNDGQWRHFAVVREGATSSLYLDGILDNSRTADGPTDISNDADILVGNGPCVGVDGTTFFDGELDEIEYFNAALTADQVQSIFNGGSAGQCKLESETGPAISSVTNGASERPKLARGTNAFVNGRNLTSSPEAGCPGVPPPWPTSHSACNAMVLVNGEPAPIRESVSTFIGFEIPFEESAGANGPPAPIEIVLDVAGVRSNPVSVELERFAPAMFMVFDFGDFRRVTPQDDITLENRAVPGEILRVLATGLGPTVSPIPPGAAGFEPKILIHGLAGEVREAEVLSS